MSRAMICGALWATGFALELAAAAQTVEWGSTPCTLTHVAGDDPRPDITANVYVPSVQPDSSAGIQVLVDIGNVGSEQVELIEPVEHVFIEVRDAAGREVSLPWIPPSLRGHRATVTDPAVRERLRQADEDERHFRARELPSTERDPAIRAKSLRDLDNENVVLAPSEHFQFVAVVATVLADPVAYATARRPQTEIVRVDDGRWTVEGRARPGRFVPERGAIERFDPTGAPVVICGVQPIPLGTYRLQVELTLVFAGPGGGAVTRKSDSISVELGRQ